VLTEQESNFDRDTRFALACFEQRNFEEDPYGEEFRPLNRGSRPTGQVSPVTLSPEMTNKFGLGFSAKASLSTAVNRSCRSATQVA
jgi:hypothetical protein